MRHPLPLVLLSAACGGNTESPPPAPTTPHAPTPQDTPAAAKKKARPKPAPPPAGSCALPAFQLVAKAYAPYQAGKPPAPLADATCWTDDLGARLKASAGSEQGVALGFDPLVNAQDHQLSDFSMKPVDGDTWQVRFTNLGQAMVITWELVEVPDAPGNFRVADLHTSEWRLSELLKR